MGERSRSGRVTNDEGFRELAVFRSSSSESICCPDCFWRKSVLRFLVADDVVKVALIDYLLYIERWIA